MPDGPPWIDSVVVENVPTGSAVFARAGYHITLDENRLWGIVAKISRPAGNSNEIAIFWIKPSFGGGDEFLTMNDNYPKLQPLQQNRFKFDNEDIYLHAMWKEKFDPKEVFKPCNPIAVQRDPKPPSDWCIMTFGNGTTTVEVRLDRQT